MDMKHSQVTNQNKYDFFRYVYHQPTATKESLVDLDCLNESTIILIDCCGWYYKKFFPHKSIVGLETIRAVKDFGLDKTHFDRLIDNRSNDCIGWPSVVDGNCAVVLDRSPLLKYRTLDQLSSILDKIANKYAPSTIVLEQLLTFIDDARLVDRLYNIATLAINGYIVTKFNYDLDTARLSVRFQKKVNLT